MMMVMLMLMMMVVVKFLRPVLLLVHASFACACAYKLVLIKK